MRYPTKEAITAATNNPSPEMVSEAIKIAKHNGFRFASDVTEGGLSTMMFHVDDPRRVTSPRTYIPEVVKRMAELADTVSPAEVKRMIFDECQNLAKAHGLELDGPMIVYRNPDNTVRGMQPAYVKFEHEAKKIVDQRVADMDREFRGAVCSQHPELRGQRQITTYRCTGCQRDSRVAGGSAAGWAEKRVKAEIAAARKTQSNPEQELNDTIRKLSVARGWKEILDSGKWYDSVTGKVYSPRYLYNDAQAYLVAKRKADNARVSVSISEFDPFQIRVMVSELIDEINEEEGLEYSVYSDTWHDPKTGAQHSGKYGHIKAYALLKQRLIAFGTHKRPDDSGKSHEQMAIELRHRADQLRDSGGTKIVTEANEERLQAKLEATKVMVAQREAKEKARIDAKLAKAKADAEARAKKFKADPLSRWK